MSNKTYPITISQRVKSEILSALEDFNFNLSKSKRLNHQFAIYLFHYIKKKVRKIKKDDPKNSDEEKGYVRLCSSILKRKRYDYNRYLDFLMNNEFIQTIGSYDSRQNRCTAYRINPEYLLTDLIMEDIYCTKLNKVIKHDQTLKRMEQASVSTGHLTKWFNPNLTINYEGVRAYYQNRYGKNNKDKNVLVSNLERCFKFAAAHYYFYRDGRDNRLHTNLTVLSKESRKYITYKGEGLVSIDIKSSQPYLFLILLHLIHEINNKTNNYNKSDHIIRQNSTLLYIASLIKVKESDIDKLQVYKRDLIEHDLYSKFFEKLRRVLRYKRKGNKGTPIIHRKDDKFYIYENKKRNGKSEPIKKFFNTGRAVAKHLIFKALFHKEPKCTQTGIHELRELYPTVTEFLEKIKQVFVDYSVLAKENLSILLQNLESRLILDLISKDISNKYPYMPLFTIHDSIATVASKADILETEFKAGLKKYMPFAPEISREKWF